MSRSKSFMLFDTMTEIDPITMRPMGTVIENWTIGNAKSFSNLGTQSQSVAGISFDVITDKIKIYASKYKLQKNILVQNLKGEWSLWKVLKPEDVVPKNQNLINLVLQEKNNNDILSQALQFYQEHKDGT